MSNQHQALTERKSTAQAQSQQLERQLLSREDNRSVPYQTSFVHSTQEAAREEPFIAQNFNVSHPPSNAAAAYEYEPYRPPITASRHEAYTPRSQNVLAEGEVGRGVTFAQYQQYRTPQDLAERHRRVPPRKPVGGATGQNGIPHLKQTSQMGQQPPDQSTFQSSAHETGSGGTHSRPAQTRRERQIDHTQIGTKWEQEDATTTGRQYEDEEEILSEALESARNMTIPQAQLGNNDVIEPMFWKQFEQYLSKHGLLGPNSSLVSLFTTSSVASAPGQKRVDEPDDDEEDPSFCCRDAKSGLPGLEGQVYHCYACKMTFCDRHWLDETPHKRNRPGHDKINADVAKAIEDTLENRVDEREQTRLHILDGSASWFGAIHGDDGVVFRDFGRYASLMTEYSLRERKNSYPALVSFVGDTGAGKSSLIKLLVSMKTPKVTRTEKNTTKSTQTPVVGNNAATSPTSGDVHLYADPETFHTQRPILYADCEGLRGGTLEPGGARWRRRMHNHNRNRNRTASFDKELRQKHESAEREILWATTPAKSTRKYFVEHLYPRLLYTFSDVIVFVVKNARMIEDVMEQLVVWADAVIESVNNQPVLPHAIIVLNAFDDSEDQHWNVDDSTTALLNSITKAVDENPKLKSFAAKWTGRGFKISSIQSLLLAYYSSVRVIRIPEKKRPQLIHDQVQKLYTEIGNAVAQSHEEKHKKRLDFDAEALQPYLQQAFDHFCTDLSEPFDFIKAAFAETGIPSDFCGNTLKLAAEVMKHWSNRIDGELLFKELSFLVASCVMLDCVRQSKPGSAGAIFKAYLPHFDETLDDFCEKVWPCEFVNAKGRCINVQVGHAKGHQLGRGELIAGEYEASFSAGSFRHKYRHYIYSTLQELLTQLSTSANEREIAAQLHLEQILKPFYLHVGGAHHFITLKPDYAGTRVLSLDGGGVRGVLMLKTLEAIEADLGAIPIQNFFDLIIGTSTGGIIALGLSQMKWSVSECRLKFEQLAIAAFKKHRTLGATFDWVVAGVHGGRYKIEPLEEILAAQFTEDENLFGGVKRQVAANIPDCRAAVTTTSLGGTPFLLANYNRIEKGDASLYTFLRAEKPTKEMRVWEAARATSAAPKIFKPYVHLTSGHTFIDGGVYYNNPIEIALREEALIWQQSRDRLPDVLLSLGTGYSEKKKSFSSPLVKQSRNPFGQLTQNTKQLVDIATNHVKSSLKSEEQYNRIRDFYPKSQSAANCFKRFNYYFERNFGKLTSDNVEQMPQLIKFAKEDLAKPQRKREIRDIANRLIASTFYFDVEPGSIIRDTNGRVMLAGHIRCRLSQQTRELKWLGDLLASRTQEARRMPNSRQHSPYLVVVADKHQPMNSRQYLLDDYTIHTMQVDGHFSLELIEIAVTNCNTETDIYIRIGEGDRDAVNNSISGFPRCWDDKSLKIVSPKPRMSDLRQRQASRRGRPAWTEPSSQPPGMLGQYANQRNPGLATDDEMSAVESRLSNPKSIARGASELPSYDMVQVSGFDYEPKLRYHKSSEFENWLNDQTTDGKDSSASTTRNLDRPGGRDGRDGIPVELDAWVYELPATQFRRDDENSDETEEMYAAD